ncbi:MAG: trypsin-like peptidase domain-containing protein [Coriobacteriia bacterium]|nr:trypsin-like peptidase domain-containing protein [Coriobacteriia bacterium]
MTDNMDRRDSDQEQGSAYSYTRDQLQAAGGTAQESVAPEELVAEPVEPAAQPTQPQPAVTEPLRPAASAQPQPQPQPQAQPQPQHAWEPAATRPQPAQPQYQVNPAARQAYTAPAAEATARKARHDKPGQPKDRSGLKTFGMGFAGAALACVIAFGGNAMLHNGNPLATTTVIGGTGSQITAVDQDASLPVQVSQKCLPSVASIDVYAKQSSLDPYGGLFGMYGYSDSDELTKSSLGSGVVLSKDGYIITNYHVIENADALKVTVGGNEYDAEIVGSDESSDVAVIKAKGATDLVPMDIGDSDQLTVGEWVMSIGSPFGLEQSVATGIVSATSRSQIMSAEDGSGNVTMYPNMIQTDAAINPGNSGGALVDSQGRLIGINTMITSYSGNYSGVGFAIPVNYAINLAQQIMEGKTPTHAQLGVTLSSVDKSSADRYGFDVTEGAYISSVASGSGADKAGLQVGDIVTKLNDTKIKSASDLMLAVRSQKVGSKVTVEYHRDGKQESAEVTLGSDGTSSKKQEESKKGQEQGGDDRGQGQDDQGYNREQLEDLFERYFGDSFGYGR